jgi:hypothetical protein
MTQDDDSLLEHSESAGPPGMPRWVKVTAIVVGLLVLLFLVLQLTGLAGEHGPGMHSSLSQLPLTGAVPW